MYKRYAFVVLFSILCFSFVFSSKATLLVHGEEGGTTYYVSSLNGNDNNDGKSEDSAFFSLEKINEMVLEPGDKVLLEAESVFADGFLHIKGSGSEEAPIIIDRYGDGKDPLIQTNGEGVWYQDYGKSLDNPGHRYEGYVSSSILLYDVEYIEISNLEITNTPTFDEPYSDIDKMNRTGVAGVAQNAGTLHHIYLKNLNIHDVRGNVYDKHMLNGGIYMAVFEPENESETGIPRYDDILVEDNIVNDVSRWGIAVGYTTYYDQFLDAKIEDETIATYGSTNVVIRNNYIKDPGGDAITTMYLDRPIVEYNVAEGVASEINDDVYSETDFGKVAAGIWPWKSKDAVFQYNEVFDTNFNQDGQAWDADYGDGAIYQYNYSHNNGGGSLMVCLWDAVNTTFRYNVSQNDLDGVLSLPSNPDAHIYNNVFYVKEGTEFIRSSMSNGTAVIENNIIYNSGDEEKEEDWEKQLSVSYSNNLYYNYANTPDSDEFAITEDPLFVNPGTAPTSVQKIDGEITAYDRDAFDGYKLQADSPAINKGKFISASITHDFFGNPIGLIPDIGIHEVDADEELNDFYVDGYKKLADKIIDIPKETTVKAFKQAVRKADSTTLDFEDRDGNGMTDDDVLVTGSVLLVSYADGTTETYELELSKTYKDYEIEESTAKAGSEQSGEGANLAFDGDSSTIWHTAWAGTDRENVWISFDLGEIKPVERLTYMPRQSGGKNGIFTEYKIEVRDNEADEWQEVSLLDDNVWANDSETKYAYFDTIDARYIKLTALDSHSNEGPNFGSAAEIAVGVSVGEGDNQ